MMEFIKQPMAIERRSMELIAPYIEGISLSEAEKKVYSRIIHADATAALRSGADIYTDVEMVRTGINKRKLASFGGAVHCRIQDPEIAAQAKAQGVTRSLAAMRSFGAVLTGSVVAIGNAPTALIRLHELIEEGIVAPALVIGVPVGFVNALAENRLVPYITVEGTKGGSPIAAAAVNAMLYEIDNSRD